MKISINNNKKLFLFLEVGVMVFNVTFNNISVISCPWGSVLLMEETGVP